jgi:hypothetical protein
MQVEDLKIRRNTSFNLVDGCLESGAFGESALDELNILWD